MDNDRQRKLDIARKLVEVEPSKQVQLEPSAVEVVHKHMLDTEQTKALQKNLKELSDLVNENLEASQVTAEQLSKDIGALARTLNLKPELYQVHKSIDQIKITAPDNVSVNNLSDVIKAIHTSKTKLPEWFTKQLYDDITKALVKLTKAVEDNSVSQKPDDFQPVRRVVSIGSRLIFDDNLTGQGNGGGGTAAASGSSTPSTPYHTGSPAESVIAVGVTSTAVLSANSGRTYLHLVNDSDTTMYISIDGGAAVASTGTRLNASGGSIVFDTFIPTTAITAIHGGSGSKSLLVTVVQ